MSCGTRWAPAQIGVKIHELNHSGVQGSIPTAMKVFVWDSLISSLGIGDLCRSNGIRDRLFLLGGGGRGKIGSSSAEIACPFQLM